MEICYLSLLLCLHLSVSVSFKYMKVKILGDKVQATRPMDSSVQKFGTASSPVLQLRFKELLFVEFWLSVKEEYPHSSERVLKHSSFLQL